MIRLISSGLRAQHAFRQISEVEPGCDGQTYKADDHCRNQERSHGALLTRNLFTQSRHCPGYRPPVIQYLNYTSFAARYQRQWLGENTIRRLPTVRYQFIQHESGHTTTDAKIWNWPILLKKSDKASPRVVCQSLLGKHFWQITYSEMNLCRVRALLPFAEIHFGAREGK